MILKRIPDKVLDREGPLKETMRVSVIGACRGAGASFVSAYVLRNGLFEGHTPEGLRTLCELGTPYFYQALGFDRRFAGRTLHGFSSHGKHELNMEMGYNWYVKVPEEEYFEKDILRNFYGAAGSMAIFDCSGLNDEPLIFDIAKESDLVYLVVDPMPTKLISSEKFIDDMRKICPRAELVVNRFAKGIHRGELKSFLGTGNYHKIDAMPIEDIYKAEYNCVLPV